MAYKILWSENCLAQARLLDHGHQFLLQKAVDDLERSPPLTFSEDHRTKSREATLLTVTSLRGLAELCVETVYLNAEIGKKPGQWFLLWTMDLEETGQQQEQGQRELEQVIKLHTICGYRSLESARRGLALAIAQTTHDISDLRKRLQRHESGPAKFFVKRLAQQAADDEDADGLLHPGSSEEKFFRVEALDAQGELLHLSQQQQEALHLPGPLVLQGRSGTAKTTLLEYRAMEAVRTILQKFPAGAGNHQNPDLILFVTASPRLAASVRQHFFQKLLPKVVDMSAPERLAAFGGVKNPTSLEEARGVVFLTFSQFARMLDRAIRDGEYFFENASDEALHVGDRLKIASKTTKEGEERCLTEGGLKKGRKPGEEVGFAEFAKEYWPKISFQAVQGGKKLRLNAHDAYREILTIKGGFLGGEAGDSTTRGETTTVREWYVSKSLHAYLTEQDRAAVYELFERYEKLLRKNDAFDCVDVADQIWARHKRYKERVNPDGYEGQRVGWLLVDEAQDLVLKQMQLFSVVCDRVDRYCFAADPAQCIAHGRSFKLAGVKALWQQTAEQQQAAGIVNSVMMKTTVFPLTKNYRSHQGILDFANAVTKLLSALYPGTINTLPRETSTTAGETPVMVFCNGTATADESISTERFLNALFDELPTSSTTDHDQGNEASPRGVKKAFGADQVVLVRSPAEQARVLEKIGRDDVVVLTVHEAKGLEFHDCLCWNFFSCPEQDVGFHRAPDYCWHAVYSFLEAENPKETAQIEDWRRAATKRPKLSGRKQLDTLWAQELKELYVMATRARKRLLFFEEASPESVTALRDYLSTAPRAGVSFSESGPGTITAGSTEEASSAPPELARFVGECGRESIGI